jgi:hypothetical protein
LAACELAIPATGCGGCKCAPRRAGVRLERKAGRSSLFQYGVADVKSCRRRRFSPTKTMAYSVPTIRRRGIARRLDQIDGTGFIQS